MTHGTTATITMALDHYAEVFCHSGLAVLLYDHRNFGMSGGELRQQINPWIQARGYRDAMNYLLTRDDVRANRIAVWGDSYSGMIALVVGALEPRVAAVAVQCPTCGVEKPKIEPSDEYFQTMQGVFADGDVRGTPETTVGPMPVVSFDQAGTPSLLKPIQAFRWFIDYGGRHGSLWENCVTRVVPPTPVPFSAYLAAPLRRAYCTPNDPRPVQHGGGVELIPGLHSQSALRLRADCGGRLFTAKLAVIVHYLPASSARSLAGG